MIISGWIDEGGHILEVDHDGGTHHVDFALAKFGNYIVEDCDKQAIIDRAKVLKQQDTNPDVIPLSNGRMPHVAQIVFEMAWHEGWIQWHSDSVEFFAIMTNPADAGLKTLYELASRGEAADYRIEVATDVVLSNGDKEAALRAISGIK
jgi:hypothetical protein